VAIDTAVILSPRTKLRGRPVDETGAVADQAGHHAALPQGRIPLSPHVDGVVLAPVLTVEEQERLRACVDEGGGVFLIGAPDGGALPIASEAGAAISGILPGAMRARRAAHRGFSCRASGASDPCGVTGS